MIKCINCNYYYTDGKTEYCCYYNDEISMIIIRSMCSWIEDEDGHDKDKDGNDAE